MKKLLLLSVIVNIALISCAAAPKEYVSTWVIGDAGIQHHASGVSENKSFVDAKGFRCYSREDDERWRARMALCCNEAGL